MESTAPNPPRPNLEVHGARASSGITQHLQPGAREAFLEWQRGLSAAAAEAPGYQTTEIYTPANDAEPWVIVIHFDTPAALRAWLDSPKRAEWLARKPVALALSGLAAGAVVVFTAAQIHSLASLRPDSKR